MVSLVYNNNKFHKVIEVQKFIIHRSWGKVHFSRGHTGRSRQVQAGRQDLGLMPLLRSLGAVLWAPPLRPDWSLQK